MVYMYIITSCQFCLKISDTNDNIEIYVSCNDSVFF